MCIHYKISRSSHLSGSLSGYNHVDARIIHTRRYSYTLNGVRINGVITLSVSGWSGRQKEREKKKHGEKKKKETRQSRAPSSRARSSCRAQYFSLKNDLYMIPAMQESYRSYYTRSIRATGFTRSRAPPRP